MVALEYDGCYVAKGLKKSHVLLWDNHLPSLGSGKSLKATKRKITLLFSEISPQDRKLVN